MPFNYVHPNVEQGVRKTNFGMSLLLFLHVANKEYCWMDFHEIYRGDILLKFVNVSQLWALYMKTHVLFCMHHNCNLLSMFRSQIFNKSYRGKWNIFYAQHTFLGSLLGFEINGTEMREVPKLWCVCISKVFWIACHRDLSIFHVFSLSELRI
jgi:hypothetical protein